MKIITITVQATRVQTCNHIICHVYLIIYLKKDLYIYIYIYNMKEKYMTINGRDQNKKPIYIKTNSIQFTCIFILTPHLT